jgi:hypothetical protein
MKVFNLNEDNVLSSSHRFPGTLGRHLLNQLGATIDAGLISGLHLHFEPVRYSPTVHTHSRLQA